MATVWDLFEFDGGARSALGAFPSSEHPAPEGAMGNGDRYVRGWRKFKGMGGQAAEDVIQGLKDVAPALARYLIEFSFGDIYSRPGLDPRMREVAAIAALTALANARPQLRMHIHGALNAGCTREEIVETIIQMAVHAGFPAALNGIAVAKEVFAERGEKGGADRNQAWAGKGTIAGS